MHIRLVLVKDNTVQTLLGTTALKQYILRIFKIKTTRYRYYSVQLQLIICILCYKYYCNNTPIILKLQYGNSGCSMIKVASNWVYMTCDEVYSYHLQHFNLLFQLLFAIDSVIAQRFFCVQARFHNISCQFYCSQFDMLIRPYMVCFFSQ